MKRLLMVVQTAWAAAMPADLMLCDQGAGA